MDHTLVVSLHISGTKHYIAGIATVLDSLQMDLQSEDSPTVVISARGRKVTTKLDAASYEKVGGWS